MPRTTAVLLSAVLYLLPPHAAASGLGPAGSRLILMFDLHAPRWTVKAKLRLLPTFAPFPVWGVSGTIRCNGEGCPGRRARIAGFTRAAGEGFNFQADFRRGAVCTFAGTIHDPTATNTLTCVDAAGDVTLDDTFHVGLCRCFDRIPGSASAFCATDPCQF